MKAMNLAVKMAGALMPNGGVMVAMIVVTIAMR